MVHVAKTIDELDASVFSGDLLWNDDQRELLKRHIERWSQAIAHHESTPIDEGDDQ